MNGNPYGPGAGAAGPDRPTVPEPGRSDDQWWGADPLPLRGTSPGGSPPAAPSPSGLPPAGQPPSGAVPPGPPFAGPPPSSGPPEPDKKSSNTTYLVIAGIGAALAVTLIGGFFVVQALRAPAEMSVNDYAGAYCEAIEQPSGELLDAAEDYYDAESDLRNEDYEFSRVSEREASELQALAETTLRSMIAHVDAVAGFSNGHRLRGSDGETLHEDIVDWADTQREELEDSMRDLDDVDAADGEDAAQDISDALIYDVEYVEDSDEVLEVAEAAYEENDECLFPSSYEIGVGE